MKSFNTLPKEGCYRYATEKELELFNKVRENRNQDAFLKEIGMTKTTIFYSILKGEQAIEQKYAKKMRRIAKKYC